MAEGPIGKTTSSRRSWLLLDTIARARRALTDDEIEKAVDQAVREHPDWDMDEQLTLAEWRQSD